MKDSTIYAKWREQDKQYQQLVNFIQGQYQNNIKNMNDIILSVNALKSILIDRKIMTKEELEEFVKNEVEYQKKLTNGEVTEETKEGENNEQD